jgi:hypothetical protein
MVMTLPMFFSIKEGFEGLKVGWLEGFWFASFGFADRFDNFLKVVKSPFSNLHFL